MKKRYVFLLLFVIRLASAETWCVSYGHNSYIVDSTEGEKTCFAGSDASYCVRENELFAIEDAGGFFLVNNEGKKFTEIRADCFENARGGILYSSQGLYGLLDEQGQILIAPTYTQLVENGKGEFLGLTGNPDDDNADEILYIRATGEAVATGTYILSDLTAPVNDYIPYCDERGKWGYLSPEGISRMNAELDFAGVFVNENAVAAKNGKKGLINAEAQWILDPLYDEILLGEDFVLMYDKEGELLYFDPNGSEMKALNGENAAVYRQGFSVKESDCTTVYGSDGQFLASLPVQAIVTEGSGGDFIVTDGAWGDTCWYLLRGDGTVGTGRYQQLTALDDGRYAFMETRSVHYDSALLGEERFAIDYDHMKYGIIDRTERIVVPAEYTSVETLSGGYYFLQNENTAMIADHDGFIIWTTK